MSEDKGYLETLLENGEYVEIIRESCIIPETTVKEMEIKTIDLINFK